MKKTDGSARRRLNPYEQALRKPKQRALAIRAKCWDCEGRGADPGWQRRVRECVVLDCPLWHVRPYQPECSGEPFREIEIDSEGQRTGSVELVSENDLGTRQRDENREIEAGSGRTESSK